MLGLFLAVVTSMAWSAADVCNKRLADKVVLEQLSLWLVLGQLPLMYIWALSTANPVDVLLEADHYWEYGLICGVLNMTALMGMFTSLRLAPMSLTIPLLSLTPLISAIFDYLLSDESLSTIQWFGLSIITLGATTLGLGHNGWFKERGAWFMIGVAIVFSILFPLDRVAAFMVGAGIHTSVELTVVSILLIAYLLLSGRSDYFRPPKRAGWTIACAILAMTCALGVQMYAYELGTPVAIMEVVKRSIGMFAAIGFGAWLFNEQISTRKLASAGVMTIGIAVLLLNGEVG